MNLASGYKVVPGPTLLDCNECINAVGVIEQNSNADCSFYSRQLAPPPPPLSVSLHRDNGYIPNDDLF
jgi:hypothetical protein